MFRAGLAMFALGVVIFIVAAMPLLWDGLTAPDANSVGNGLLLTAGWWVGGTFAGLGLTLAAAGMAARNRRGPLDPG